jgi:hypothetical protein
VALKPSTPHKQSPVTARAVVIGLLLIPPQVLFILHGLIWGESRPTTVSLIFNVIVTLLVVCLVNNLVRKFAPARALSHPELATIYAMLTMASSVVGLDQIQTLVPVVAHPFYGATPENGWEQLFLKYVPKHLTVSDHQALWAYFDGHQGLFDSPYWRPWVQPALWWAGFSFVLLLTMLCLNTLFRKQWTEEAKLSFPIVQIPLEMTSPKSRFLSNRLMWIGFALAFALDALNGLHQLYPMIPNFLGSPDAGYDLGAQVKSMPWNAIGWTPLNVFPFAVGLAFFIPVDLAFSCWFFYILWKFVRVLSAAAGWGNLPQAPWIDEQSFAAYIALAGFCLWAGRKHLRIALESVFRKREFDDSGEPMPYRYAVWGVIGGFALLLYFCLAGGMTASAACGFLTLYLLISIAVARIRAELGSPVHDLHKIGPEVILTEVFGPESLGKRNLVMFSFFWGITRAHRSHPMPHQIESMKLAEQTGLSQRGLAGVIALAMGVGIVLGWTVMLDCFFRYGGEGSAGKGVEAWGRLQGWLQSPSRTNWYGIVSMLIGGGFTVFLAVMRAKFAWFPLHPAGFAVSGSWSMALFAPSILVSWVCKVLVLRYGGMSSFRPASNFFMGMVLGEFLAGAIWGTLGILLHQRMYNFLP